MQRDCKMRGIRGIGMKKFNKRFAAVLVICSLLLMTLTPVTPVYAATKDTYYIKVNRKQNCITIYSKDEKGKYTVPVKAMACSVDLMDTL